MLSNRTIKASQILLVRIGNHTFTKQFGDIIEKLMSLIHIGYIISAFQIGNFI